MPLTNDADDIFLGDTRVSEVLVGAESVWAPFIVASGGTVEDLTIDGILHKVHTFNSGGTFEVLRAPGNATVEYVVVAGGGGGGANISGNNGGGGGAGGYRSSVTGEQSGGGVAAESPLSVSRGSYPVVVGSGGGNTASGLNSSFSTVVSVGGGRGGRGRSTYSSIVNGVSGGSGGGAAQFDSGGPGVAGAGTAGQGFAGGSTQAGYGSAAAGGGASGAGQGGVSASLVNRTGGAGVATSITGSAVIYSRGADNRGGTGAPNTGNGGGGGTSAAGQTGGSGRVIIRYRAE